MPKDTADEAPQSQNIETDFCIIGAGAGGLALASAAAAFGQRVVLIEKHKMGGDSLNYGGVQSKALLAAAKRAYAMRTASPFGIRGVEPLIDHAAVNHYIDDVTAKISPNFSIERFTGLGIRVISAAAKFVDRSTVVAGDYRITARRIVIATGSSPIIPPIPGLADVPYFTNETIFDNTGLIPHLLIIGAGTTGLELAQAYRRLGSRVTVLDNAHALGAEDPELAGALITRLSDEGIVIREGVQIKRVSGTAGKIVVELQTNAASETIEGTAILLAAGRKANIADLGLDAAGVKVTQTAIKVNAGLRTANSHVFAIGDATGAPRYAHVAGEHAETVLRRSLFRLPARAKARIAPRVVFTDPELATVGLNETEARAKYGRINVLRWPYHENDRAQLEHATDGHIKVITSKHGKILGAGIVGAEASELIQMWSLAISQGLNIKAMTEWISPYPTLSEINKKAAFRYFATVPSNPFLRKVIALLAKLG
ncbi:dihydrolipoyl dehydrogenase family protein [Hyphomicrobium facile]|uniref:Pyruvate/2-oxoglutarate dehydrogenase complex, dihydrolipoamide dehydrogenase (E3) component n=1 Tax=Hyphomicrobium facile TaxID=51670 RepID=A0A1I7NU82_9HYPH|nr:FAD-dependent oxidoreductase [Hyphomicrobium facile]SFV38201.1 Pyruvate/2-oxoglutarate dehydrogenase complex, dihydrolipoamide dehydrogenase (E3) component [Hyphomicrobium facile]